MFGFFTTSKIIGEACRGLSDEFRLSYPDEIWRDAISFRNVLVHHYFGIDEEAVWAVVERDLLSIKQKVQQILRADT